ncbi:MAG: hypothetical protein PHR78_05380 [Eubacteriales bacterium]|nr:hypothetical protein [Eubacteriales bacterium]MDD4541569.1 hypothetical protein [Eubacteriales bacterium]
MAFTLESAVAASTAFYILVYSLGLSLPLAKDVSKSAALVAKCNAVAQAEEKLYSQGVFEYGGEKLLLLEGSPQKMVELLSLTHDLSLYFRTDE